MSKLNTKVAGIDVSKLWLDVAIHGEETMARLANSPTGHTDLVGWLKAHGVWRVGLEASGGYERMPVQALNDAGFEVVLHQPLESAPLRPHPPAARQERPH